MLYDFQALFRRGLTMPACGALLAGLVVSAAVAVAAQSAAPAFTVASIKPSARGADDPKDLMIKEGGVFIVDNMTLERLIQMAYRPTEWPAEMRADRIVGLPAWARQDRYDIEAHGSPRWNIEAMPLLRTLLEDRFRLTTRWEGRERQVYVLRRARSDRFGEHFTPRAVGDACEKARTIGPVPITFPPNERGWFGRGCTTMLWLLLDLEQRLRTDVIDETGITGSFDFLVSYPLDLTADPGNALQPNDNALLPAAVERDLGLTLTAVRRPVDTLIVVSVSHPAPN
jgi:uncharacterized protein (TIGR03435 family)